MMMTPLMRCDACQRLFRMMPGVGLVKERFRTGWQLVPDSNAHWDCPACINIGPHMFIAPEMFAWPEPAPKRKRKRKRKRKQS